MSRARRAWSAALLAAAVAACAAPRAANDPRTMRFPTLPLEPPSTQRVVLDNGLVLLMLPDAELPLVDVRVLVRTGSVLEPADRVGLAEVAGAAMRTGGAGSLSGTALSERLETLGAVLETGIGRQSASATLSVLAEDLPEGIGLLADVLRRPSFDPEEVERVKRRKIEEIRRGNDEPDEIAFREFRTAVYRDDPRGRQRSPEMVERLGPGDLAAFHAAHFFPDRTIVGASGMFEPAELLELVRRHFGDWEPSGEPAPEFPVPSPPVAAGVRLAPKSLPQATVIVGHLAPPLEDPDHYAFTLVEYILGGAGFSSRLTERIRSDLGLAYSVGSFYRGDRGYGVYGAYVKTKTASVAECLRLVGEIVAGVRDGGVTERELRWAKDAIVNNLIFAVDGSREVVARKMSYEYDGLPPDHLERFRDRIEAVTMQDARRAARAWLAPPGGSAAVVVGDPGLETELAPFGPLRRIELRRY